MAVTIGRRELLAALGGAAAWPRGARAAAGEDRSDRDSRFGRLAGHHAEASTAMGFCLFNKAAIAVRHAQQRYGAERTAIVDFDAHHGNARNKSSGVIKG
jgi:acetoin utilization deacetylase AcuC-like enzyme